jgi:hypothetical protein
MVQLLRPLPVLVAATVTLGVAPLLFLQVLYGRLFFVSSVLMAWWWLAVPFVLIAAYYATYAIAHRAERSAAAPPWMHVAVAVVLLGVAFLYTTNMTLMLGADRFASLYAASGRGLHLNVADATLWPRLIHMIAGAVAVAGLAVVLAGFVPSHRGTEIGRLARGIGARASLGATVVNMATGVWWAMMLPSSTLQRFVGGNSSGTLLFVAAIVFGIATCGVLVSLNGARASAPAALGALASMLATVGLMLLVRDQVRADALERMGFASIGWVVPQWGPFVLFALFLLGALGTVAWMVAAFLKAPATSKTIAPAA